MATSAAAPSAAAAPLVMLPENEDDETDRWTLQSWARGAGVHRVVAAALRQAGDDPEPANLAFLRGMPDREALRTLLATPRVTDALVSVVWDSIETLQTAGAATTDEIQSKFAGSTEMSMSGLSTFYGGLSGVVGGPRPKVRAAMAADHTQGQDADDEFVTGNYGVATTSRVEWLYVTDESDTASPVPHGYASWPAESHAKLPNLSHHRRRRPLSELTSAAETQNAQLCAHDHPPLIVEELIGANLYTGPVR